MSTKDAIINKLREAFLPESLDVVDESHLHEGHAGHSPGGETHFRVYIVSPAFEGKSRIERHRMINAALAQELAGSVHALALDRATEELLRQSLGQADGELTLAPDLETARRLVMSLESQASALATAGKPAVVLAPPELRRPLFDFASRFVPDLWVVSARELVPGTAIESAGVIALKGAVV